MKYQLVRTKNMMLLHGAMEELIQRMGTSIPCMGLLVGRTGAGKTTAIATVVAKFNPVTIRAYAAGSLSSLLDSICTELKVDARRVSDKQMVICKALMDSRRALIVDEADYLTGIPRSLDVLRDIHDTAKVPVILVGMSGLEGRLVHMRQLTRRISVNVTFEPCDLEDARLVADTLCEVTVEEDLLVHLHTVSRGCIGLLVVALARVEAHAKEQRHSSIDLKGWGQRQLFLGSEIPE